MKYIILLLLSLATPHTLIAQNQVPANNGNTVLSSNVLFNSFRTTLQAEINKSLQSGDLTQNDLPEANRVIENYLTAAAAAYEAQISFALYSLKPLWEQNADLYTSTLIQYRSTLQTCYINDFRMILAQTDLIMKGDSYNIDDLIPLLQNEYAQAIQQRGGRWDYFGRGGIIAHQQAAEYLLAQFKLKQQYVYALLSPQEVPGISTEATQSEWFANREFLSCAQLRSVPQDYVATRAAKWIQAEELWMQYAKVAAEMISVLPRHHGTGTGGFIYQFELELISLHERFLTRIMQSFNN